MGWACVWLASWWGNGSPRRRSVADLRGWSATLELRYGPNSYGRQQWGLLHNGRKPDAATPRERLRPLGRKALSLGKKQLTVPLEEDPANSVPEAAVIGRGQALSGIIGRKGYLGGLPSAVFKAMAEPLFALRTGKLECRRGKRNS